MPAEPQWTYASARTFIQELEPLLREAGWGVALGGSLLTRGMSYNDLDLILFPLTTERIDFLAVYRALKVKLVRTYDKQAVHAGWRRRSSMDEKHVEVWYLGKQKVDVFFLK